MGFEHCKTMKRAKSLRFTPLADFLLPRYTEKILLATHISQARNHF